LSRPSPSPPFLLPLLIHLNRPNSSIGNEDRIVSLEGKVVDLVLACLEAEEKERRAKKKVEELSTVLEDFTDPLIKTLETSIRLHEIMGSYDTKYNSLRNVTKTFKQAQEAHKALKSARGNHVFSKRPQFSELPRSCMEYSQQVSEAAILQFRALEED